MNLVDITAKKNDPTHMLESLDSLREKILAGEIVAFAAVGIEAGDQTRMWSGRVLGGSVTRLRMMGAIANLQYHYHADSVDPD